MKLVLDLNQEEAKEYGRLIKEIDKLDSYSTDLNIYVPYVALGELIYKAEKRKENV